MLNTPLGAVQALQVHFYLALNPALPTLVLGDFNQEDGGALAYLNERGMRDAVQQFAPGQDTWRWPLPIGSLSFTLDHVFYDQRLRVLEAKVLDLGRSDHKPVRVVLQTSAEE